MYDAHAKALGDSLKQAQLLRSRAELGLRMFDFFFERYPETKKIFSGTELESFAPLKFRLVSEFIVDAVKNHDYALYNMVSEIYRHRYFDVKDAEYYYGLMDACCRATQEALGSEWTPALQEYWQESLQAAKSVLQDAMHKAKG